MYSEDEKMRDARLLMEEWIRGSLPSLNQASFGRVPSCFKLLFAVAVNEWASAKSGRHGGLDEKGERNVPESKRPMTIWLPGVCIDKKKGMRVRYVLHNLFVAFEIRARTHARDRCLLFRGGGNE